jgi:hypothetical protein
MSTEFQSLSLFDVYEGSERVQVIRAHDEEEVQKFIVPEWYPSGKWEIRQREERKTNNA